MNRFAIRGFVIGGGIALSFAPAALAQFHAKKPTGQTAVNQQAVNTAQQQAINAAPGGAAQMSGSGGGGLSGGDMIMPEGASEAFKANHVRLGQMKGKRVDIWGRAIHHSDGSFTESKQDLVTNTLEQITKSKGGVKLQRRMVMLDEMGRPGEILIYDGREQFKYRGLQVYDNFGRFAEEQLYDAQGTLIRRKVQGYDPRGEKLPLRSWDYVANVPEDLKLVITKESEDPTVTGGASGPGAAPDTSSNGGKATPAKKGFNLRGIFGKKAQ